jgi:hypothetical protein
MKNISFVLFTVLLLQGCEKGETLNIQEGQDLCPINWFSWNLEDVGSCATFNIKAESGQLRVSATHNKTGYLLIVPGDNRLGAQNAYQALGNFKTKLSFSPKNVQTGTALSYYLCHTTNSFDILSDARKNSPHGIMISKDQNGYDITLTNGVTPGSSQLLNDIANLWRAEFTIERKQAGNNSLIVIKAEAFDENGKLLQSSTTEAPASLVLYFPLIKLHPAPSSTMDCQSGEWLFDRFDYSDDSNGKIVPDDFDCNTILTL